MSVDVFESLAAIRAFLGGDVQQAVAQDLRGELRAAIKTLENVEAELAVLPGLVHQESRALLALCGDAVASLCKAATTAADTAKLAESAASIERLNHRLREPGPMTELVRLHGEVSKLTSCVLVQLQSASRNASAADGLRTEMSRLLAAFYAELGQQAGARIPWQSVFTFR